MVWTAVLGRDLDTSCSIWECNQERVAVITIRVVILFRPIKEFLRHERQV